ncbi:MAG: hypothetical protein HZA79_05000 [Sphingobacteriales bacterium]|nr:hypothetical protein [Sphingobacteriales bacterium]
MSNTQAAVKELLQATDPDKMKDWLHDIQTQLISAGYCRGMTDTGAAEFAGNFKTLQDFFTDLKKTV